MGNRQGRLRAEEGIKLRYFKESYAPENALPIAREGVCVCMCEYAFELGVNDGIIHSKVEMKYSCHPKYSLHMHSEYQIPRNDIITTLCHSVTSSSWSISPHG